jgi:hypothetical protein
MVAKLATTGVRSTFGFASTGSGSRVRYVGFAVVVLVIIVVMMNVRAMMTGIRIVERVWWRTMIVDIDLFTVVGVLSGTAREDLGLESVRLKYARDHHRAKLMMMTTPNGRSGS